MSTITLSTGQSVHSSNDKIVYGISARAISIGRSIWTSLQSMPGGRIPDIETKYHELIKEAHADMIKQANDHGAKQIIGIRYDVAELSRGGNGGAFLICYCYGTAIRGSSSGGAKKKTKKTKT